MEKKLLELQKKLDGFDATTVEFKEFKGQFDEIKSTLESVKKMMGEKKEGDEATIEQKFAAVSEAYGKLQDEVKTLNEVQAKKNEFMPLADALKVLVESKDFKTARETKGFDGKGMSFELKVDTTSMTGGVSRTQIKPGVSFAKEDVDAITPLFRTVPMGAGKDRVLWIEGAYTSNAGYAGEGTAIGTDDTGTAQENSRELAKISAKIKLSAEMFEDLPSLAAQFEFKLQSNTRKFLDKELLSGDGNDTTQKKHIYGLLTQGSTPFVVGDFDKKIDQPTIDNLADCMVAQADSYTPNVILINKADAVIYGSIKGTDGQTIIRNVNGVPVMGGLRVIKTNRMALGSMLALDTDTLELDVKRNLEFKISQEGTDFSTDQYTAVTFLRCQALVEALNKVGNIYVADIEAALTLIRKI